MGMNHNFLNLLVFTITWISSLKNSLFQSFCVCVYSFWFLLENLYYTEGIPLLNILLYWENISDIIIDKEDSLTGFIKKRNFTINDNQMFLNENIPSFTIAFQVICFILFSKLSENAHFIILFYYLLYIFTKPIEFQRYALGPPSFLVRDLKGRTYINCHSSNSHGTHRFDKRNNCCYFFTV